MRSVLARDAAATAEFAARMSCIDRILVARNRRRGGLLSAEDLEDLRQEGVATVLRHLPSYRGIGSIEAWTHSFCDHAFRNAGRRRIRERQQTQPIDENTIAGAADAGSGLEDPLHRCLQRLTTVEQWILQRKHHDDATLEEIAAAMGSNLNTLKSKYLRALRQLRDCLGGGTT